MLSLWILRLHFTLVEFTLSNYELEINTEQKDTPIVEHRVELVPFDEEKTVIIDGEELILIKRTMKSEATNKIVGYNKGTVKVVNLFKPATAESPNFRTTVYNFDQRASYVGPERAAEVAEQAEWEVPN